MLKQDFHVAYAGQIGALKASPMDKIPQIVNRNYPMLHFSADDEEAVGPSKNTLLFERKLYYWPQANFYWVISYTIMYLNVCCFIVI